MTHAALGPNEWAPVLLAVSCSFFDNTPSLCSNTWQSTFTIAGHNASFNTAAQLSFSTNLAAQFPGVEPGHHSHSIPEHCRDQYRLSCRTNKLPPCNRRRRLWFYRLHRLQGCRPLLAASRPTRPRRRWRHRPHPRHRGLRHRRRVCTPRRPRRARCRRRKAPPLTCMPILHPLDGRPPLSKARWVESLACSRWSSLRWLASSYGWWGCLEHCVRARCETGRKEHVGVSEEGRSRDVLDGESGWLSFSASTGWRALNANPRPRPKACTPFQGLRAAVVQLATRVNSFPLPAMLG